MSRKVVPLPPHDDLLPHSESLISRIPASAGYDCVEKNLRLPLAYSSSNLAYLIGHNCAVNCTKDPRDETAHLD